MPPFDVLDDDERLAMAVPGSLDDMGNARVAELGLHPRLVQEAGQERTVRLVFPADGLDHAGTLRAIDVPHGPQKHLSHPSPGKLLEQVGAKSETEGGAAVHAGHANILINAGGATASDILTLSRRLRQRVKEKFGYELAREIIHLGPRGPEPERWEE